MNIAEAKWFHIGDLLLLIVTLHFVSGTTAMMYRLPPHFHRTSLSSTAVLSFFSSRFLVSNFPCGGTGTRRHSPSRIWFLRGGGGCGDTIGLVVHRSRASTTRLLHSVPTRAVGGSVNDDYQSFLEENPDKVILSYITDIEGDKFYLDRFVETSKVLTFVPRHPDYKSLSETTTPSSASAASSSKQDDSDQLFTFPYDRCIDFSSPNSILVFGGDLWDKGGYDLYVARQLLDLKRRFPHRVFWVLGNRDINKLRILQELGLPGRPIPYHPGLTWFRKSGRVGDPDGPLPPMNPGERLQWILSQTMGSPDAMEHRRQELAWERQLLRQRGNGSNDEAPDGTIRISDDDVVHSYRESCHPRGELGLFLSHARLALTIGPVLFVHGSLPLTPDVIADAKLRAKSVWDDLTFALPWLIRNNHEGKTSSNHEVKGIEDWIETLNQFCYTKVKDWKSSIAKLEEYDPHATQDKDRAKDAIWAYRAGYHNGPAYSALIQYGMGMTPDGRKNPTVVYNSFTPEGMPKSFFGVNDESNDDEQSDVAACTREFFDRAPVQLILTGHKPQGDMPSPIKVGNSAWVICADTSYSGDTIWWQNGDEPGGNDGEDSANAPRQRGNLGRGNARSFRGDVAVSEVLVELSCRGQSLDSVYYHGVLSDGTEYQSVNLLEPSVSQNSSLGKVAPNHLVPAVPKSPHQGRWWTKSIFSDGSQLFYAGEGFNVWNYVVKEPTAAFRTSGENETTRIKK